VEEVFEPDVVEHFYDLRLWEEAEQVFAVGHRLRVQLWDLTVSFWVVVAGVHYNLPG
jgi:hypothetical protein